MNAMVCGTVTATRCAAEQSFTTGLTQLGIRNVSSTARDGYEAARAMGSDILSVRQCRALGVTAILESIMVRYQHSHQDIEYRRVELITGRQQRRDWTGDEKAEILAASVAPGSTIA
jgi:hypothetical protein